MGSSEECPTKDIRQSGCLSSEAILVNDDFK